ncbi:Uncharacterized protein TPAR_03511 [Tolypocladium paradoxum]|uniref:DUF7582 domain-containing protein n=1 Tax=Tolypocladium paradoxum TaxID=94208 RepID=A0A2S4L1F6_9HYPO|nr:Uncharacterized protein TPAR_03511 [Tolypocladium paradoxum]
MTHSGGPWLSPAVGPAACGLSGHLFNRSVAQNEVLFSSEGLTLVSLDRLYSLKSALSSYSKTRSPRRLEDAVDELRRAVLASGGAKVRKADLLRSYDWLGVSAVAVADLDRMYRRAYGGPGRVGAISGVLPPPPMVRAEEDDGFRHVEGAELHPEMIGLAITTMQPSKPPSPRGPSLRLQTRFETRPLLAEEPPDEDEEDDGDGDLTARPRERLTVGFNPWPSSSIDQVLSAGGLLSPAPSSRAVGSMTPNGYDDISPVTRGEWAFLMVDNALQGGRTVAVETF